MTSEEKESFYRTLALLFSPPDQGLAEQVRGGFFHSFFLPYVLSSGQDPNVLKGFLWEGEAGIFYDEMRREYDRLFSGLKVEGISLVESFYKPWTLDPQCPLPFAFEKGLMMGDSALHLSAIYDQCCLEISDEFKGCPDHLIIELDFLAHLYRWAGDGEIKPFIKDHLDWIPLLREEVCRLDPHPFYRSLLDVLTLFLETERKRLEVVEHGEKDID
jgi:TorA maturation chaperone TorD